MGNNIGNNKSCNHVCEFGATERYAIASLAARLSYHGVPTKKYKTTGQFFVERNNRVYLIICNKSRGVHGEDIYHAIVEGYHIG
jgi:hypothetical protein